MKPITNRRPPAGQSCLPPGKPSKSFPSPHPRRALTAPAWGVLSFLWLCAGLSTGFAAANLVVNPGFELPGTDATAPPWYNQAAWGTCSGSAVTTEAHSGLQSWVTYGAAAGAINVVEQMVPIIPGGLKYAVSYWVKIPTASAGNPVKVDIRAWFGNAANLYISGFWSVGDAGGISITTPNWTQITDGVGGWTPAPECVQLILRCRITSTDPSMVAYIDDASVTTTAFNLNGTVALSDAANPTGATVVLKNSGGTAIGTNTVSSVSGAYSFIVVPGTYTVAASKTLYTPGESTPPTVVTSADATVPTITLVKKPTATVSGKAFEQVGGSPVGVAGVVVKATNTNDLTTVVSAPTPADGSYSLSLLVGQTYQISASSIPLGKIVVSVPGPFTIPSTTPITGKDVQLGPDPDYNPNLLVNLKASTLTVGTDLASWPNIGTIRGTFDKFSGGTGPDVKFILGKKSVEFKQASSGAADRRTLASAAPAPTSLSGNNPWTISTLLYRRSSQPGGENAYAQWAGGSYADAQSAIFNYTPNRAYMHWGVGYDIDFQTMPGADTWHNVTITYDGTTEIIYVDGLPDRTTDRSGTPLSINAGGLMLVGGRTWHDARGEDQYWRFNGAMASLKIFDKALSAAEVAALVTTTKHTITVTAGSNGSVTPGPGAVSIDEGDSPTFAITPSLGYRIVDVLMDGVSNPGAVVAGSYTFSNVTAAHTISATFGALPPQVVSGKVISGATGVLGAKVYFKLSPMAYSTPLFTTTTTNAAGNYAISLPPATYYVAAGADGYDYTADTVVTVSSAPVTAPDLVLVANPNWDVMFSLNTDMLSGIASGARIISWNGMTAYETYNNGLPMLGPVVETIGTNKWEQNTRMPYDGSVTPTIHDRGDGFLQGTYANDIPVSGVTIVAVVKPTYVVYPYEQRGEIVDIFYSDLFLAVNRSTGEVIVCTRGYVQRNTGYIIPDGQKTILSLVVKPTGDLTLYANGDQQWSDSSGTDYTTLKRSVDSRIAVGRNGPDGWSAFNGNLGDIHVFRRSIPDAKRKALESSLAAKFDIAIAATSYNWAGPNNGSWSNPANWNNTIPGVGNTAVFSDTVTAGATVDLDASVEVKGVTFNNLVANQNITSTMGSTLTLMNGAALSTLQTEAGAHTISAAVDAGMGMGKSGAGKLTLSGSVAIGNASTINPVFVVSGTSSELVLAGPTTVAFTKSSQIKSGGKLSITGSFGTSDADQIVGTGVGTGEVVLSGTGTWTHIGGGAFQIGNDAVGCVGILTIKDNAVLDTMAPITVGVGWGGGCVGIVNQTGGTVYDRSTAGTGFGWAVGYGSSGTYNFDGGVLETAQIYGDDRGVNVFNFNGGTLRALNDTYPTDFITLLTHAYVKAGGAIIDDNGFSVALNQSLEHGPDAATDGGFTKLGLGTLTLTKASTYTGPTKVQAGVLSCATNTALAAGDLEITALATLDLAYTGTRTVASLKIAGSYKGPGVYGSTTAGITGTGTVTVGAPGLPLSGFTRPGGVPTFSIEKTAIGSTYRLVYRNNLTDSAWTPIGAGVAGNNGTLALSDTTTPLPKQRFYKLEVR